MTSRACMAQQSLAMRPLKISMQSKWLRKAWRIICRTEKSNTDEGRGCVRRQLSV